jgi:hypothetical protein
MLKDKQYSSNHDNEDDLEESIQNIVFSISEEEFNIVLSGAQPRQFV